MNTKDSKQKQQYIILCVMQRILGFPFFAVLALIGAMAMWFKWIWNFIKYGGEAIAYTDKMSRKTIQDVFVKLTEMQLPYVSSSLPISDQEIKEEIEDDLMGTAILRYERIEMLEKWFKKYKILRSEDNKRQ